MQNFSPVVIDIYPPKILVLFIYSFVRKCQLKSCCFNFIASFWQLPPFQWKLPLKKLDRPLKVSIKMASGTFFRVLQCFEDFETIFAFLLNLVTNSLFRSISVYAVCFSRWRRADFPLICCSKQWFLKPASKFGAHQNLLLRFPRFPATQPQFPHVCLSSCQKWPALASLSHENKHSS